MRRAAFAIMALYTLFAVAMIYGDALTDPGGLAGVLFVVLSALAFGAVALIDWAWPRLGRVILLLIGTLGAGFHAAIGFGFVDRSVELGPNVGPIVLLFAFLPVPFFILATLHARKRPLEAGWLILGVGLLFALSRPGVAVMLAGPAMIAGGLFVADARRTRPAGQRGARRPLTH